MRIIRSLPSRKCGLKLRRCRIEPQSIMSLPSRKCGLKSWWWWYSFFTNWVTSLAEVWIEISNTSINSGAMKCHFPRGSVDWNHDNLDNGKIVNGHFPRGSVDWNIERSSKQTTLASHFPRGSVDWNYKAYWYGVWIRVTSLAEVWIEILIFLNSYQLLSVTSLAEVWIEIAVWKANIVTPDVTSVV